MEILFVAVGLAIVAITLADAFDTLLATRIRADRHLPTDTFYRLTWKLWRSLSLRIGNHRRRESLLSAFGPLSLIGLLTMWTFGQILGWGLVWWGLHDAFGQPISDLPEALYYSGVVYFSIGFGDLLPAGGAVRILTITEAFGGLGTLGLVIGFLPSLNAAYQARETQLLRLDDLSDSRITPSTLVRSCMNEAGDTDGLDELFKDWEHWCAEVFESHTSFPMLTLFRSQHRGHSWVTALGVVTDAAIASIATFPGTERGPAMRLYRQSCRLVQRLAERIGLEPVPDEPLLLRYWSIAYSGFQDQGHEMRRFEDSYQRLIELRSEFHPYMEAFISELLAPHGFWGVTSADHLAEVRFGAFEEEEEEADEPT